MQKKHGFAPLGPADGPVKNAVLGLNAAKHYRVEQHADTERLDSDGLGRIKTAYLRDGQDRSNLAYGYVPKPG
jgi:hypothetical protein